MTAEDWARGIEEVIDAAKADGFEVVNSEYNEITVMRYGKEWGYIYLT
jgi:hypothetical protein